MKKNKLCPFAIAMGFSLLPIPLITSCASKNNITQNKPGTNIPRNA